MLKRSTFVAWLAVMGCGDDRPLDLPPHLLDQQINVVVPEDGTATIDATATDPDSLGLIYSASKPSHGTLTGSGPVYTYTPAADYHGMDALIVSVSDGTTQLEIPVVITVSAVDDAPVASDLTATTNENQGVAIVLTATDVDNPTLRYAVIAQPAHGTVTGVPPNVAYTPSTHYYGTDSFTYQAYDPQQGSNVATVTITTANVVTCGDGVMEGAEQCDDGNTDNTDGCLSNCMIATCGDGAVQAGVEQCDDGNGDNTDACLQTCVAATCGDGFVQAGVEQCDDANASNNDACLDTCHIAGCGDGFVQTGIEQCDDGNDNNGDACLNSCVAATCGDGVVQAGVEQCDDGNGDNTDGCLNTCVTSSCGDGVVQAGVEQCDDGNDDNSDGCLNTCVTATCGDGFVQNGVEQCDDANQDNTDACLNTCVIATCGDGFVQAEVEQCDDGNLSNNDTCLNSCVVASCGDGFVELGAEQCDDGNLSNNDACLNTCQIATCGDGFTFTGFEQCDDGNHSNNDACLNTCVNAFCGDGFTEVGTEQCDDANSSNTDACLNTCVSAFCGDGFTEAGIEQCDDANPSNNDACLNTCQTASCGDGFVELGVEQCDDANNSNSDACLTTCVIASCGDGFTQTGVEQCDDGNASNGDACLDTCVAAVCGDGFTEVGVEACDDGNQNNNDACRNDCTIRPPDLCGNGVRDPGEECDDGNTADNDGCGHSCKTERCGDGLVQFSRGEQCDDGNTNAGDGCDATCQTEPFETTAAIPVSGTLSCTTSVANAARKVAVDGSGTIYIVMQCGASADVAVSADRGMTFSEPFELSADLPNQPVSVAQVAINNGPSGVAYAAIMLNTGEVFLRTTEDGGQNWEPAVSVGQAVSTSSGLSLQTFNDDVYIGFATNGGVAVARSHHRGGDGFEITPVGLSIAYFDLLYDIVQGTLVVAADTPTFHIRASSDAGVTFAGEVNPPGQEYYSDWAIGNGRVYSVGVNLGASGNGTSIFVIPTSNLATSSQVFGLPSVSTAQSRTVAADTAGNAFVGSQLNAGGVQLDRLAVDATTFDAARSISATGGSPVVCALPGNQGAAVVYTDGTSVYATMQVYDGGGGGGGGIPGG